MAFRILPASNNPVSTTITKPLEAQVVGQFETLNSDLEVQSE
jgi:hypothetical protein